MQKHPLAEVFGFPVDNFSPEAERHRTHRLCPFHNKSANCTKDKVDDPLGTCSIFNGDATTITCPIRFREDWLIVEDAASFFFPENARWTSLPEVRLNDKYGKSAGNVDLVLVSYDSQGKVTDFGSLEVQAVYISGNVRTAFAAYMDDPQANAHMDWSRQPNYPRPDFLSSSRKRLAPQLLFKGGIFNGWEKKQAVAVDRSFFSTLPVLPQVPADEADIAWFIYDLVLDAQTNRYKLTRSETIYTAFSTALSRITVAEAPPIEEFLDVLQRRLSATQVGRVPVGSPTLFDALNPAAREIDPEDV